MFICFIYKYSMRYVGAYRQKLYNQMLFLSHNVEMNNEGILLLLLPTQKLLLVSVRVGGMTFWSGILTSTEVCRRFTYHPMRYGDPMCSSITGNVCGVANGYCR